MHNTRSKLPDVRCKPFKVDGTPLHHIAPSRKGSLLLAGGPQALVKLELLIESPEGDDLPGFKFDHKRYLLPQKGNAKSCRGISTTGISFLPGSDAIAASCSGNGQIFMWDILGRLDSGRRQDCLLKQWQGHIGKVACVEFLPRNYDSRLVSADSQGHIFLWKLDRDLWESSEDKGTRVDSSSTEDRLSTSAPQRQCSPGSVHMGITADSTPPSKDEIKCHHAIHDIHVQPSGNSVQMLIAQEQSKASIIDLQHGALSYSSSISTPKQYFVSSNNLLTARFHPHFPCIFGAAAKDEQFVHIVDSRFGERSGVVQLLRVGSSVGCIRWRPDRPNQLAASGGMSDVVAGGGASRELLIWDLRRPYVPLHRFNLNGDSLPDFFWADTNHVISCGRDSTVQLHSVGSSVQPLKATCCSGASWSVGKDGSERLALFADEINREAEPPSVDRDLSGSISREFAEALKWNGFSADVGLPNKDHEDMTIELQKSHECYRSCGLFSTSQGGRSDDELKLQELLCLAPFPPQCDTASAAELCAQEAQKSLSKGMSVRAQTWKLLAKVTSGNDMKPFELLSKAILGDATLDFQDVSSQFARGAGALVAGIDKELSSPKTSNQTISHELESPVSLNLRTWQHTWRMQTLHHIIQFHEERNDVGMLLSLVSVFGIGRYFDAEDRSDKIDLTIRRRVFRWIQGAADLLSRYQAFVARTALLRALPLEQVQQLTQAETKFRLRCCGVRGGCKEEFFPMRGCHSVLHDQKASRRNVRCTKCTIRRRCCIVCGDTVRGLWTACQVCGHGGHMRCIREWFSNGERQCPGGCGHHCVPP